MSISEILAATTIELNAELNFVCTAQNTISSYYDIPIMFYLEVCRHFRDICLNLCK